MLIRNFVSRLACLTAIAAVGALAIAIQPLSAQDKSADSHSTTQAKNELPYNDDPKIVPLLESLGDNTATLLPFDRNLPEHKGRRTNDYSMRMAYAPERETALYAGGNHNNGRYNDCWEYHLGSNTWYELFPAEGGDHYALKQIMMYEMRRVRRDMQQSKIVTLADLRKQLKEKDRERLEENIAWWKKHVVLRDGMFTTKFGGLIMPSHTWDGLCYDPISRRMLWTLGGGPSGEADLFHHYATGMPHNEIQSRLDPTWTAMWTFDPEKKRWQRYRQPEEGPCPDFRGMGQSLEYLPDRKRHLWYVAASNVVPHSYQMWSYDPQADRWAELKPNGGQSISSLVKQGVAPGGEQVIRYSPVQRKLYAFQEADVFSYDVDQAQWKKELHDNRFDAHDARTAISYDSVNDVFLYARKEAKDNLVTFAAYDPKRNAWKVIEPHGAPMPKPQWQSYKTFFHKKHNVFVLALGGEPVWVYRYKSKSSAKLKERDAD